jgi:hypothetical protein
VAVCDCKRHSVARPMWMLTSHWHACSLLLVLCACRFRRNFRDVPWVRVPTVHWEYCSLRVLTLEYLPGGL